MGLSSELSCEAGGFSHCHLNPYSCFQSGLRLYLPSLKLWVAQSVSLPSCSTRFTCTQMWDRPDRNPLVCLAMSPLCLASYLHPSYQMHVCSLTPWSLDFHTVQFSVSSGCFLFLNLLLSSFGCARRHSVSTPPSWPEEKINF